MFFKSKFLLALSLYYCGVGQANALQDGDFYKIIHSTGKVLTVGSNSPVDGADIIITDWKNEPNQKWLAVQAVVAGDNYLLLTQQQRWNWLHFIRNGEALRETKERHGSLPDWSLVLNGDSSKISVQPRDSKKYQQWRSEVATSNSQKVIIKNLQDNKCLQAAGSNSKGSQPSLATTPANTSESPGFFRRVGNWFRGWFGSSNTNANTTPTTTTTTTMRPNESSRNTPVSNKVSLAPCDKSNEGQQWILELVSIR